MNPLATNSPNLTYTILSSGIRFNVTPSFDEWLAIGDQLMSKERTTGFEIGDWINFGDTKYGEKYKKGMKVKGVPYQTLANYAYISRKVSPSIREPSLGHEHHAVVAKLPPDEQKHWLGLAVAHDLSVHRLRVSIRMRRMATKEEAQWISADRRQIPLLSMINKLNRRLRKEFAKCPLEKWDMDRRLRLKNDLKCLSEIYDKL
jgi:hypothetical protein